MEDRSPIIHGRVVHAALKDYSQMYRDLCLFATNEVSKTQILSYVKTFDSALNVFKVFKDTSKPLTVTEFKLLNSTVYQLVNLIQFDFFSEKNLSKLLLQSLPPTHLSRVLSQSIIDIHRDIVSKLRVNVFRLHGLIS